MYARVSAILLAGGNSTRMGFDKQKILTEDGYLIDLIIQRLKTVFSEVIVVTQTPDLYGHQGVRVVGDLLCKGGPLAGLHAGLRASSSPYSFLMACDMPNLNVDYIAYMVDALQKDASLEGVITRYRDWIEPFHGLYAQSLMHTIPAFVEEGGRSMYHYLRQHRVHYVEERTARGFSEDWSMFDNINEPGQLIALKELGKNHLGK